MIIRKLLFNNFRRATLKKWNVEAIPSSIQTEYDEFKIQIEQCYKQATHWHGTGRYHYKTIGKSKYVALNDSAIIDVLKEILNENGLKPHDDPWVKVNAEYATSISTSKWRMYARTYAELHMFSDEQLQLCFGERKDIINFFFYYTIISSPPLALWKGIQAIFDKKRFATKGPIWAKTINNTIQSKGNAFSDLMYIMGQCHSNITNNYGILIGIKGAEQVEAQINPIIEMFESRFIETVPLKNITHIEVPYANLEETIDLVKSYRLNIPVFSIEACEMYSATLPIYFFANDKRLPKFPYQELVEHYKRTEH